MGSCLTLHPGPCVVFDRGYNDYSWYQTLTNRKITFVTRLKRNAVVEHLGKLRNRKVNDVESDKSIRPKGIDSTLCLVTYKDPGTDKVFHFLTNSFRLEAFTIAALYKERWQIELFFKWIKQNLKVKTLLGTSKNAILTQLWIALCVVPVHRVGTANSLSVTKDVRDQGRKVKRNGSSGKH